MKRVSKGAHRMKNWILCIGLITALTACAHQPSAYSKAAAGTETALIEATLMDYIDGTAKGQPDRLHRAFHPDFNLYAVRDDKSLRTWAGKEYVAGVKEGKTNSRQGKIISIDYEKDVAVAKVEILIPGSRLFTDYFLLAKYEDQWRIIHKSYTSRRVDEE